MHRDLNACGFSSETIAAEYETDAALIEAGSDLSDPYFLAAFAAEEEQRNLDRQAAARPRSFAEAMANPIDRAIFADSLDIALGGGCGLCDTERDHMCVGCGKCRCFDHGTCTRPAAT